MKKIEAGQFYEDTFENQRFKVLEVIGDEIFLVGRHRDGTHTSHKIARKTIESRLSSLKWHQVYSLEFPIKATFEAILGMSDEPVNSSLCVENPISIAFGRICSTLQQSESRMSDWPKMKRVSVTIKEIEE